MSTGTDTIFGLFSGGACSACALHIGLSPEVTVALGGLLGAVLPGALRWARGRVRPWLRARGMDVTDDGRGVEVVDGPLDGLQVSLPKPDPLWRPDQVHVDEHGVPVKIRFIDAKGAREPVWFHADGVAYATESMASWYPMEVVTDEDGRLIQVSLLRALDEDNAERWFCDNTGFWKSPAPLQPTRPIQGDE